MIVLTRHSDSTYKAQRKYLQDSNKRDNFEKQKDRISIIRQASVFRQASQRICNPL